MFNKGPGPNFVGIKVKPRIIPKNRTELNKYGLLPYYKTRDFRKKIAILYYGVQEKYTDEQKGRFPVFKLCKNNGKLKPDTASASSAHRP